MTKQFKDLKKGDVIDTVSRNYENPLKMVVETVEPIGVNVGSLKVSGKCVENGKGVQMYALAETEVTVMDVTVIEEV